MRSKSVHYTRKKRKERSEGEYTILQSEAEEDGTPAEKRTGLNEEKVSIKR